MPASQKSSRSRYAEYRRRQSDPSWSKLDYEEAAGKRPVRGARGRSFSEIFRRFLGMLRGYRATLVASLCTLTVATALSLAVPSSTKLALDFAILDHPGPEGLPAWIPAPRERHALLWWIAGVMTVMSLLAVVFGIWGRWQVTKLTKRLQARMRRLAFAHAVHLPLHRVQALKSGGIVSILREDAGQSAELLFSLIYNPWRALIQLVGTLAVLALVDWRMLLGGLLIVPVVWLTHRTWIGRLRPIYRDVKVTRTAIDSHTTEVFGGMRVVRGFSRAPTESLRFTVTNHLMGRQEMLTWWWSRIIEIAWSLLIPAASAAVLLYGGSRVIDRTLTVGDVMMFTTYVLMLLSPLETLTNTAANVQQNLAGFDRILDLLEEETEFGEHRGTKEITRAGTKGRIELRDVWFAYPAPKPRKPADAVAPREPVIRGVSLTVEPGQTVAFVGPSGSGKTTLCNLIARFYDATQGQILLDGTDLRDINPDSFRRLLGIVEQDVFLFDGTIADNIAYGRRGATPEQIEQAALRANADGFIRKTERGYHTFIGERGVRLSGGQKQRLAIARALLADPALLILDEATSNLDAESEALIQHSLRELMRSRTCFVIAHRLSTIRHADLIVVVEDGRIIETGTHEQLLSNAGRYSELLKAQLEGAPIVQPPQPAR